MTQGWRCAALDLLVVSSLSAIVVVPHAGEIGQIREQICACSCRGGCNNTSDRSQGTALTRKTHLRLTDAACAGVDWSPCRTLAVLVEAARSRVRTK